ncbi:hypothetical protein ACSVDE_10995 [Pseudalkalibacillus sp. Hm43]|uniref:hypothetical protein n=1 Tax=Pseudalkalibacillus sp. Hm43 TaxID=3450742 RepID=UPI003F424853
MNKKIVLTNRDKQILIALETFRIMDRNAIELLFFSGIRSKVSCNRVMLRLRDRGLVEYEPRGPYECYLYHPKPRKLKFGSRKQAHYLGILRTFLELSEFSDILNLSIDKIQVEPRFNEVSFPQPDALLHLKNRDVFLEYQNTQYQLKTILGKLKRYESFYKKGVLSEFPIVWILTDYQYKIPKVDGVEVIQTKTVEDFVVWFTQIHLMQLRFN